ncbi:hypothetical protein LZ198_39205 [Myxococcus sp. K15C18031901]|uniref:hypothetical protein n=1 Tax=Myxococcus dinghuensis TaxID=2906761 RepID=UPI0020A738D2|nr:hypothetical protein [Myxococcus dinghuensis]MCP3104912.1 hypothetical protein [Myxococcus dinghuensis]
MAPSLFDDLGYQDVRNPEAGTDFSAADDRTLRMAAPALDGAMLDALVRYQEAFLTHAGTEHEPLAVAHQKAQAASGLDLKTVEQGAAMLRAFGGRRWTARKLQDKLEQLKAASGPDAEELRRRIQGELFNQERETEALARRYGDTTLALLREREATLLDLHTRMTRLLSHG